MKLKNDFSNDGEISSKDETIKVVVFVFALSGIWLLCCLFVCFFFPEKYYWISFARIFFGGLFFSLFYFALEWSVKD